MMKIFQKSDLKVGFKSRIPYMTGLSEKKTEKSGTTSIRYGFALF
jgi:hypothetical protein